MAKKQKRYHEIGSDGGGAQLFEECGEDTGRIVRLERAQAGKPIPPWGQLVVAQADPDGEHYHIEAVELASGPAQVASTEYRVGWDNAFGGALN